MSSLFSSPKIPKAPAPAAPPQKLEQPKENEYLRQGSGSSGQMGTILTGDLQPMGIGKRRLLA